MKRMLIRHADEYRWWAGEWTDSNGMKFNRDIKEVIHLGNKNQMHQKFNENLKVWAENTVKFKKQNGKLHA